MIVINDRRSPTKDIPVCMHVLNVGNHWVNGGSLHFNKNSRDHLRVSVFTTV